MRLTCRERMVWHSLPVAMQQYAIRLPSRTYGKCHSLPVGHGIRWDEPAWQKRALSHTCYWSRHDMLNIPTEEKIGKVTHKLLVMRWDVVCLGVTHSLLVMGWYLDAIKLDKGSATDLLLVVGWDIMSLPGIKKVSLTFCWSGDQMWWKHLAGKVTYILIRGYEMKWPQRGRGMCHSHPVCHGKCNWTAWQKKKVASPTRYQS